MDSTGALVYVEAVAKVNKKLSAIDEQRLRKHGRSYATPLLGGVKPSGDAL